MGWLRVGLVLAVAVGLSLPAAADSMTLPSPWQWLTVTDSLGRSVRAMISDAPPTAPVAVILPGSGCAPIARARGNGVAFGLQAVLRQAAPDWAVIAVEKPGSAGATVSSGDSTQCPASFHVEHTLERWSAAVRAVVTAALATRTPSAVIAIGHSEGAATVTHVAHHLPRVTHVVHLAGSGTGQAYDLLRAAEQRRAGDPMALERVLETLGAIRANPDSADQFAWGHPFRRWSGYLTHDPAAALLASRAAVMVVYGTADRTVPPESSEILVARLAAAGHPVRIVRVEGADHGLNQPGEATPAGLMRLFGALPSWVSATHPAR